MTGQEQIEHVIGCNLGLLNGREPLTQHARSTGELIGCFNNITGCIDIRGRCTQSVINPDPAPTSDAAGSNEVNQRLNTNGNQHHFTRNALSTGGDHLCNLAIFAHNLRDFFPGSHVNAIAALLLQHHIGGHRVKHL